MKTSKKIVLYAMSVFLALGSESQQLEYNRLHSYRELNDAETRLLEYKDDDERLAIKLELLDYVNASRAKHGAKPVELDILASRVANKQAREAAEKVFTGHWNSAGEKPYHRYAFAGGVDHVAENAAARWSSANLKPDGALEYAKRAHDDFMAEKAPYDGHKQTVIKKEHTHVGLGYWLVGKQFRYYEEYVDRYFEYISAHSAVLANQAFKIEVKPPEGQWLYALIAYYEPKPKPMTPAEINAKSSYGDFTDTQAMALWPFQLKRKDDGSY